MYKKSIMLMLMITAVALTGCFHAKVTTGLTPSSEVHDKPFASGWILGLIPPPEVSGAQECSNGVARVETKLSFVNRLVGFITFGIYTPMHITVTCAAASADLIPGYGTDILLVERNAAEETVQEAFSKAGEQAASTGNPVFVGFN
jgi:hypothetical protein